MHPQKDSRCDRMGLERLSLLYIGINTCTRSNAYLKLANLFFTLMAGEDEKAAAMDLSATAAVYN